MKKIQESDLHYGARFENKHTGERAVLLGVEKVHLNPTKEIDVIVYQNKDGDHRWEKQDFLKHFTKAL